jgi:hypothetical protein
MFRFQAETENEYSAYGTKPYTVASVSSALSCFMGKVLPFEVLQLLYDTS